MRIICMMMMMTSAWELEELEELEAVKQEYSNLQTTRGAVQAAQIHSISSMEAQTQANLILYVQVKVFFITYKFCFVNRL